jgi:hypothetical protein
MYSDSVHFREPWDHFVAVVVDDFVESIVVLCMCRRCHSNAYERFCIRGLRYHMSL